MAQCTYFDICGLEGDDIPDECLCILHSPDLEKDQAAFAEALKNHQERRGHRYTFMVFPDVADFSGARFPDDVSFYNAKFCRADFSKAVFSKRAGFSGTIFEEEVTFEQAIFNNAADFSHARFSAAAIFTRTSFESVVFFLSVSFDGNAEFSHATFDEKSDFSESRFNGDAICRRATFSKEAAFENASFGKLAAFNETNFRGEINFIGVNFRGAVEFVKTSFSNESVFIEATFSERTYFPRATFSEKTDFRGATFSGEVHFQGATFRDLADFSQTVFTGSVKLSYATFHGMAVFAGYAPDEQGQLENAPAGRIFAGVEVDFTRVRLAPLDAVSFRNADLRKMRLLDTDVRKIEFTSVRWPKKIGKTCVYDEKHYDDVLYQGLREQRPPGGDLLFMRDWKQRVPYGKLERLYRELKQNHEDRKDYAQGGDFHYREKEMQRRSPKTTRGRRLLLTLYKTFGGYGERVGPPLGSFLILAFFSFVFYAAMSADPVEAALHSIETAFLFRPDVPEGMQAWRFVQILQTILSPIFLGLLALAIRQRVKR